jgi:hypothetical protein
MAAVFDQIEATVEPEVGSSPGDDGQSDPKKAPQPFASDHVEAEMLRAERRRARVRAD